MDNLWILYWVTRFDDVCILLILLSIAFTIAGLVQLACAVDHGGTCGYDDRYEKYKSNGKKSVLLAIALAFLSCLIPSKDDIKFILAGVAITEVAQSDSAKRIASKSVAVIESYLDKQLKTEGEKK